MIYAIVSIIMKPSKIKFDKKLTMVNHVIANGMFALLIQSESLQEKSLSKEKSTKKALSDTNNNKVVVNESPQKEISTSNQANKQTLKSKKQFSVNKNKHDV